MKPKTKEEIKVWNLSSKLAPITPTQRKWAVNKIDFHYAYVNNRNSWCSECGQPLNLSLSTRLVDILDDDQKTTVCPHCGKKLVVKEHSLGSVHYDCAYVTVATTCSGYQVFRHFWIKKEARKHRQSEISIFETVQNWISDSGKSTVIARDVSIYGARCNDCWNFNLPMSIKHKKHDYYGYDIYAINPDFIYPHKRIVPTLKRNGFKGDFFDIAPSVLASNLLNNPQCEFLAKTNQISMLRLVCNSHREIPYKFAVNICNRNRYIIKDADLWVDMMHALEYLGKDLHSPHYICPFDLRSAHDKFVALKEQKVKKEEEERLRKEAVKWEEQYRTEKERFFNLTFDNGSIFVRPLLSVAEFVEEGTFMHHCVYANGYYKKKDSLILTARDSEGRRLETIEINLKSMEIIQSRGVCNSQTIFHDEIVRIVNDNMDQVRRLNRKRNHIINNNQVRLSA